LPGCATFPVHPATMADGRIVLGRGEFDALAAGGPAVALSAPGLDWPVLVIRDGDGFVALTSRCTHQGCRVQPSETFIRCSCHGSTFDLQGRVLRGPALDPLPQYPVSVAGDRIEIEVAG
ncbi:MAG: ubiquinol-cytochrome c reductase iron-sulfur subunit, partial [bacterium]